MHHSAKSYFLAAAVFAITFLLTPALRTFAQSQPGAKIAQVKTAAGQAVIVRDGNRIPAKVGDPVYEKDTIETGADGSIGITFIDNTVMSTGPNSEVVLEQYNFDSSNFKGAMLTDVNKGTLSMVSGDIARSTPGAMKVKTPTATLAVRGTRFAVEVGGKQ